MSKQNQQKPAAQETKAPAVEKVEVTEQVAPVEQQQAPAPVETVVQEPEAPVLEIAPITEAPKFEPGALVAAVERSHMFNVVIAGVRSYEEQMDRLLPQSPATGALQQKLLHDNFQLLFKLPAPEFREAMDQIIAIFKENKTGCFSETHLFRFSENVPLSKEAATGFWRFNHILLSAAQVERREVKKLNDLGLLVSWVPSNDSHQLLMNYFA